MDEPLLKSLLTQLGIYSAFTLLALIGGKWIVGKWLSATIEARIREGVDSRLAALKLELDKELESYRSALTREADHVRAFLDRGSADFGIWAQERHRATAQLFGDYLRLEVQATDFSDLRPPAADKATEEDLRATLTRATAPQTKTEELIEAFREGRHDFVDTELDRIVREARRQRVISARNGAHEAYYKAALYLTDGVNQSAAAVRDQFHDLIIPYEVVDRDSGLRTHQNKQDLRLKMLEFQNGARSDLAASSRLPSSRHTSSGMLLNER